MTSRGVTVIRFWITPPGEFWRYPWRKDINLGFRTYGRFLLTNWPDRLSRKACSLGLWASLEAAA